MTRRRRITHHQSITLKAKGAEIAAETRDLGVDGLYVAVETDAIKLHDELEVDLDAVDGSGKVVVYARVVRVRKDGFGRTTALGLQLEKDVSAGNGWERLVESLEKARADNGHQG